MGYFEAFPPIQALGRERLQELCNEWVTTPVARECGVMRVIINSDASCFHDVGLYALRGTVRGEEMHFPADNLMRFVIDREFSGEMRDYLHGALNRLRQKVGPMMFQLHKSTVDVI